jgi:peptidoglycan/xylan/chitin deacetylase (PgdA/CDA1 family)
MVAVLSLAAGVAVGASHGSGGGGNDSKPFSSTGSKKGGNSHAKLSPGGLGPPLGPWNLTHSQAPVPILMYHVIANPPAGAQLPELYVDPKTFDRQMEWLKSQGYVAVSLNQVYNAWKGAAIPEKPVVVSFDDGYRSQYVYARPELRKLGWPGVLSVIAGRVGQPNAELSVAMVRTLINDGWELDSHTISHVDVSQASGAQLEDEVAGSRRMLQQRFHQPVNFFCYPSGRYDDQAVQAVRAAGYLGATTTDEGLADKSRIYTLKRIRVDGSDGVSGLATKLNQAGT